MQISDFIGRNTHGDVGIEIEVEGVNLPLGYKNWRKERDGSLRGESGEYILREPIPINDVQKNLADLAKAFKDTGATFNHSPRAGIHVHINVCDLSLKEVMTMVCAYIIIEELLINFCDKSRNGNHFCLTTYDASYLLNLFRQACMMEEVQLLNTGDVRYAALNITSLFKYGSVEFRALESTNDFNKVNTWVQMLYKLKLATKQFRDPQDLLMSFSMKDYVAVLNQIMGEYAPILNNNPDIHNILRQGVLRAQDIAFSRDWSLKNLNIFKKTQGVFN